MAGGMHGRGYVWWWGGMHGVLCVAWGCAWQGACVQERWPLKQAVRILLECILVVDFVS